MKQFVSPRMRRWCLGVATVATAVLSGHVVQRGKDVPLPAASPLPPSSVSIPSLPTDAAVLEPPPVLGNRTAETQSVRKDSCDPSLSLTESPAGQLDIVFKAPCHVEKPIKVQVDQLKADATTDHSGSWEARVPALNSRMSVEVFFGDEAVKGTFEAEHSTPEQHLILAWTGTQVFEIRADVSQTSLGRISLMEDELQGLPFFATRVGDGSGASFEALSFPADRTGSHSVVRLSVDATVTAENCDQEVATIAYQTGYLGFLRPTEISYTMPSCDRVGEVVRLQNLFRDMRLAER